MALIKCPECNHEISDMAESCPNCGCHMSVKPEQLNDNDNYVKEIEINETNKIETDRTVKKNNDELIGKIAVGFILVCIISYIIIATKSNNSAGENNDMDAWFFAQNVVENNLKSPSTSKFPWYDDSYVISLGNNKYKISSYVDADNSFGATIRSNFVVTLTLTEKGYKDATCIID